MKLYAMPGFILVENPREHTENNQYVGKCIGGPTLEGGEKEALYFMGETGRTFELDGVKYHSVPLMNVLVLWDCETSNLPL